MPIVFAAITPHPPILIKEIGKDHLKKIKKTHAAFEALERELYSAQPDTIVVISEYGTILADAFTINLAASYIGNFKEFGDFAVSFDFRSDYMTIQNIRAGDETKKLVPITLSSQEEISHSFSVPLHLLTKHCKDIPIVPITVSGLDYQTHFAFGQFLKEQLARLDKRVAIIASADLSHKLTKSAPAGYFEKAADFDKHVIELIKKNDVAGLLKVKPKLVEQVGHSEIKAIITLLGVVGQMNIKPEIVSYEGPFGVGYLVANLKLQ